MIFIHLVIRWVHVQRNYKNLPSSLLMGINGLRMDFVQKIKLNVPHDVLFQKMK